MTKNPPASEPPDKHDEQDEQDKPAEKPTLPDRSGDETDVGWGDRPDRDDEDRLTRDRPPHWQDY